ncbi:rhizoferrin biosynthesis protein FslA [soil metagenome]
MNQIENKIIKSTDIVSQEVETRLIKRLIHACIWEKLLPYYISESRLFVCLNSCNKTIIAHGVQFYSLGKFKINGKIFLRGNNTSTILKNINEFLSCIYLELIQDVELEKWQNFIKEINNCLENDILVTQHMVNFNANLTNNITKSKCSSLIEYISKHYTAEQQLIFFESWASKGHPYHPCHKMKLGFCTNDFMRFSPEFSQNIHLLIAAVEKSIMHVESEESIFDYNNWFSKQYPKQWHLFNEKLATAKLLISEYYPIFIHPWQHENILIKLFPSIIENKKLIFFKDINITVKATLSFRTLMVNDNCKQPQIKLPVAVRSTQAIRLISHASVENGPKISKILKQILETKNSFSQYIKFAYESCALHMNEDSIVAKNLAIIYRDNPANMLDKNQILVVVAALYEKSILTKLPLFVEIMQLAVGETLNAAIEYFNDYCRVVIRAHLDIFLIYGIALEGHQQNTIAVFENYFPVYMISRDLSGLRIDAPTLQKKGFNLKQYPNSATIISENFQATNRFLHTVLQYHLGEIVLLLAEHYKASENLFWKSVKNNILISFEELKCEVELERWQQEYKAILQDDWQIKGLLRMCLNANHYNDNVHVSVKNPLRDI